MAGLAAVVKSVLILENGMIPPNIHLKTPNPKIPFDDWNLKVPVSLTPFPTKHGVRRISVNSFGYGGTNAHAIMDDAASYLKSRNIADGVHFTKGPGASRRLLSASATPTKEASEATRPPRLIFPLTSQDRDGLKRAKKAIAAYLETLGIRSMSQDQQAVILQDLAFTLSAKRSALQWKTYAVTSSSSIQDLIGFLKTPKPAVPEVLSSRVPRIGFVFTGQGAQWAGMGIELFKAFPVFRESVEAANVYMQGELKCKWSVTQELLESNPDTSNLLIPAYSWPLCTVLQIALVDLLKSWDIYPHSVTSHSSGEIAAAYTMGALSRKSAWKVAFYAGQLSEDLKAIAPDVHGAMLVLGLGVKDATALMAKAGVEGSVCVACVNSPSSVTISGDASGVEKLLALANEDETFARRLPVSTAYHSFHIQMVSQDYMESIHDLEVEDNVLKSNVKMHTSVTGSAITDPVEQLGAAHWVKGLISPVLFESAIQDLVRPLTSKSSKRPRENAVDVLVEIGPHSALQGPSLDSLKAIGVNNLPYFSVLKRDNNAVDTALDLAGTLFTHGAPVNLSAANQIRTSGRSPRPIVDLPLYQWNHAQKYWAESRVTREYRLREFGARSLIGAPTPKLSTQEILWRGFLRLKEEPWVGDHVIQSSILYPGAGFIAMAIEGLRQLTYHQNLKHERKVVAFRLRDIKLTAAMLVPSEKGEVEHSLSLRQLPENNWYRFTVASSGDGQSLVENCAGLILVEYEADAEAAASDVSEEEDIAESFREAVSTCSQNVTASDQFYQTLTSIGYQYGPCFANVTSISSSPNTAVGGIAIPEVGFTADDTVIGPHDLYKTRPHIIHPTFLDAVFHLTFAALMGDGSTMTTPMVPTHIDEIRVSTEISIEPGKTLQGFAQTRRAGLKQVIAQLAVMDQTASKPALTIRGFCCSEVGTGAGPSAATLQNSLTKKYASNIVWRPHINLVSNQAITQWIQDRNTSTDEILAEYIKLQHHVNASISILELSVSGKTQAPLVGSLFKFGLGAVLNTARYTLSVGNTAAAEEAENLLHQLLPPKFVDMIDMEVDDYLSGQPGSGQTPESTPPRLADIILVSALSGYESHQAKATLQKSLKALSENGRVILVENEADRVAEVINLAKDVGFDVQFKFHAASSAVFVLQRSPQAPLTNGHKKEEQKVVLITAPGASEAAVSFHTALLELLSSAGFAPSLVAWDSTQVSTLADKAVISLLELERPFWRDLATTPEAAGEEQFNAVKELILSTSSLLWVTGFDDPAAEMVTGVGRVVRNEVPGLNFRTLHVADSLGAQAAELVSNLFSQHHLSQTETEFRVDSGVLQVARVVTDDVVNDDMDKLMNATTKTSERPIEKVTLGSLNSDKPLRLSVGVAGNLETLHFIQQEENEEPAEDEIEVLVKASCLSKADVATFKGQTQSDPSLLGMDAAGVVVRPGSSKFKPGDRVMVLSPGAHQTVIRAKAGFVGLIPDGLPFELAASLPSSCVAAWYSLVHLARINISEGSLKRCIMIHDVTSTVGRQALQIARYFGADVLVTVNSSVQAEIATNSLQVHPSKVLTLSTTSLFGLAHKINRLTSASGGVDVVVDCSGSLTGESLQQVIIALNPFGHFIRCLQNTRNIAPDASTTGSHPNITFSTVDIASLQHSRPDLLASILQPALEFLSQVPNSIFERVPSYPVSKIAVAFDQLQSTAAENIVVTYSAADVVPAKVSVTSTVSATSASSEVNLDPEGIYLLSGGLGGLGRSLSTFLINQLGARKLLFLSRSGASSPAASQLLVDLQSLPSRPQVAAYPCDVSDLGALKTAITQAELQLGGKVRGVVQCAMVLRDVLWSNMTYQQWKESTLPKVQGTANISLLLPDVDFFISLSSFAGIFGNRGQANYAAGNCFQDALARHRRKTPGYRAGFTIDVPIMRAIGVLAETGMVASLKDWEIPYGIGEAEFHHIMKLAIRKDMTLDPETQITSMILGIATGASASAAGIPTPFYLNDDAKFEIMKRTDMRYLGSAAEDPSSSSSEEEKGKQESTQVQLSRATDLDQATEIVTQALVERVAKLQQVELEEIDPGRFLHTYGVDSLVAIEVVKWALTEAKSKITVFDIMAAVPMTALAEKIASKSSLVGN